MVLRVATVVAGVLGLSLFVVLPAKAQLPIACDPQNMQADLSILLGKSAPENVPPGANFTYTITVTNNGPCAATATVTDDLPNNVQYQSSGAGCTPSNQNDTVTCVDAIPAMGTRTFTITVKAGQDPGVAINRATVAATGATDPNPLNNETFTVTTIGEAPGGEEPTTPPNRDDDDLNPGGLNGFGTFDTFGTTGDVST
ncbi:MAG TPA: DUF11 domain-containing protein, partial [Actinomycetota bacterium]|nr:DUF11 domain-containing protein [Actinomycetota bacterium]